MAPWQRDGLRWRRAQQAPEMQAGADRLCYARHGQESTGPQPRQEREGAWNSNVTGTIQGEERRQGCCERPPQPTQPRPTRERAWCCNRQEGTIWIEEWQLSSCTHPPPPTPPTCGTCTHTAAEAHTLQKCVKDCIGHVGREVPQCGVRPRPRPQPPTCLATGARFAVLVSVDGCSSPCDAPCCGHGRAGGCEGAPRASRSGACGSGTPITAREDGHFAGQGRRGDGGGPGRARAGPDGTAGPRGRGPATPREPNNYTDAR